MFDRDGCTASLSSAVETVIIVHFDGGEYLLLSRRKMSLGADLWAKIYGKDKRLIFTAAEFPARYFRTYNQRSATDRNA